MANQTTTDPHPILLFDGYCNLCNAAVTAVIRIDTKGLFRFASLQSETGEALLRETGFEKDTPDSVLLIYKGSASIKSEAALDVLKLLGGGYRLFGVFRFIPRVLRDPIYDWIARNRYRWFGKRDTCMLPTPDLKQRFLT